MKTSEQIKKELKAIREAFTGYDPGFALLMYVGMAVFLEWIFDEDNKVTRRPSEIFRESVEDMKDKLTDFEPCDPREVN